MTKHTVLSFPYGPSVWTEIERWANINSFRLKNDSGFDRLYQKGVGFLVAPMMFSIRQVDGLVSCEAWVRFNGFVRLASLFILPAEMGVESGGFRAIAPRAIARNAINQLLARLGQPPIP